jgi:Protein of unknown function (DUF1329)
MPCKALTTAFTCIFAMALAGGAAAQTKLPAYNEQFYKSAADNKATIPPGTHITMQNWRNYRKFMPLGMQLLLENTLPFKVPADFEIVVGPTTSYPLPKKYREDTEKYDRQVKLVKLPSGGYTLKGYVAGIPFPDPGGDLEGVELLYDNYYNYQPYTSSIDVKALYYDRFLSRTENATTCVHFKTNHLSDVGKPIVIPGFEDIYLTENCEVMSPEESRYTTVLQVFYDDPARVQENYIFVPSLRRSLRLSAAARCAPFAGGDFTNDDFRNGMNLQPPLFQARYLGTGKFLEVVFPDDTYLDPKNVWLPTMMPKPAAAKWQLRDMYIFEAHRVPSLNQGYCYGERVIYLDKEQLGPVWLDLYAHDLKYWKFYENFYKPTRIPASGEIAFGSGTTAGIYNMIDFQSQHESVTWIKSWFGGDVPDKYHDYNRWATPGGLSMVMQ